MADATTRGEQSFELDESQLVELFADDSGAERAVAHMGLGSNEDLIATDTTKQGN